jgi:DNA-binding GntR family transcriptional regulator
MRSLEAVAAAPCEAYALDVALARPLLRLYSVACRADGQVFEYSQALHRGDRARIEVEVYPGSEED